EAHGEAILVRIRSGHVSLVNGVVLAPRFSLRLDRVQAAGDALLAARRAQRLDADRVLGVELVETFVVLPLPTERNVLLRDIQRGHGSLLLVRPTQTPCVPTSVAARRGETGA